MNGIAASKRNENCLAPNNGIDYQVNTHFHSYIHTGTFSPFFFVPNFYADTGQNNFSILDLLFNVQYGKAFYVCEDYVQGQQIFSISRTGSLGMLR